MQDIVIWDKFIRCFHWATVVIVVLNYFVLEDSWHNYLGYCLLCLLIARLAWGLCGSHNARFTSFLPSPSKIKQHIKHLRTNTIPISEGHNPIGGMMIFLLLTLLFLVSITGWMITLDAFWGVEWIEDAHEIIANLIAIAVMIHILAVLIMSKLSNRNLIMTMFTGYRKQ